MTVDIKDIPTSELIQDKADSWTDLGWCRLAEVSGIVTYGDNQSVAERIKGNKRLIEIIDAELNRRNANVEIEVVTP